MANYRRTYEMCLGSFLASRSCKSSFPESPSNVKIKAQIIRTNRTEGDDEKHLQDLPSLWLGTYIGVIVGILFNAYFLCKLFVIFIKIIFPSYKRNKSCFFHHTQSPFVAR